MYLRVEVDVQKCIITKYLNAQIYIPLSGEDYF